MVYARTAGNPKALTTELEGAVLFKDKSVVPQQTNTVEEALELFELSKPRFGLELFTIFAVIGLMLVSVGVYSVVSYTVSQQTREIGIRMALGASAGNVRRLVLQSGLQVIVTGIGLGILLVFLPDTAGREPDLGCIDARPTHSARSRCNTRGGRSRSLLCTLAAGDTRGPAGFLAV